MSRLSKILFFITFVSFAIIFATRYLLEGWITPLYIPLVIGVVSFVTALFIDFKFYLEFFTMRTTKHGMNMGTVILLVLVGLVTVNYLAVQKNKTWDMTEEKLYSLSPQTEKVLQALKDPVKFVIFFKGETARNALAEMREYARPFADYSSKVEVEFFDTYVNNQKSQQYLNSLPDKDAPRNRGFMFIEHQGKRERVMPPFGETEITSALIKATRKSTSKIYFTIGHGEREITNDGIDGISGLKDQLEQYAAQSATLKLMDLPAVPDDATAVVIAGPKSAFLASELEALKKYLEGGGRLLMLLDPGEKHDLSPFLRTYGFEFSNTYVISVGVQIEGLGPEAVAAVDFDPANEITKPLSGGNTYALMNLVSEVRKAPGATQDVQEILRSSPRSLSLSELSNSAKQGEMRSYVLGSVSKGKIGEKEHEIVVFGDSDFVANKFSRHSTNMNLFMNAVASLGGESDLISIQPKQPKATQLLLTSGVWLVLLLAAVLIPLGLLISGSVIWFRRRSA